MTSLIASRDILVVKFQYFSSSFFLQQAVFFRVGRAACAKDPCLYQDRASRRELSPFLRNTLLLPVFGTFSGDIKLVGVACKIK